MKWSVGLGRLAGIPIYVHATFALLLGWIGIVHWSASGSIGAVVSAIAFIVEGRTVGLLTLDNLVEHPSFRRALSGQDDQDGGSKGILGSGVLDARAGVLRG